MIIPDDVKTRMGWKPGDILVFKVLENGGLEITKKPMFEKDVDETEK